MKPQTAERLAEWARRFVPEGDSPGIVIRPEHGKETSYVVIRARDGVAFAEYFRNVAQRFADPDEGKAYAVSS